VLRVLRGREKKKKSKHLSVFVGRREREEKKKICMAIIKSCLSGEKK
jgi:hypothetical protein